MHPPTRVADAGELPVAHHEPSAVGLDEETAHLGIVDPEPVGQGRSHVVAHVAEQVHQRRDPPSAVEEAGGRGMVHDGAGPQRAVVRKRPATGVQPVS